MLNNGRILEVEFTPPVSGAKPVKGEVVEFIGHANSSTVLAIVIGHDKKVYAVGISALTVC